MPRGLGGASHGIALDAKSLLGIVNSMGRPSKRDDVISALPGTRNQIAKRLSISAMSVGRWITALSEEGLIYVVTHRVPKCGPKMPVFALKR